MAWVSPDLKELRNQIRQDFINWSGSGNNALLRRSVENAFSYALAGIASGLYGYINWGFKQLIPSEDSDLDTLLRWSTDLLPVPQKSATAASGDIIFTGTPATPVPLGTTVTSLSTGAVYATQSTDVISGGGTLTRAVVAETEGADGNIDAGGTLYLDSPIPGIDPTATVAAGGLSGGADEEDKFGVLDRLRTRFKSPPRGGGIGDYVSWAKEIAGVTRAYEFGNDPVTGWVTVVILDESQAPPIPGAQTIVDTQANIDLKRPIQMGGAIVKAPDQEALALTWADLIPASGTPEATAQANIESAVNQWFYEATVPGVTVSQPDIENVGQSATGVQNVRLSIPVGDQTPGAHALFTSITHNFA